uniref:Uncharacterized protein n=1 Tax=Oryza glumipatula TaxID=40148 RepID=A0A0D9ZNI4_9ORYZ
MQFKCIPGSDRNGTRTVVSSRRWNIACVVFHDSNVRAHFALKCMAFARTHIVSLFKVPGGMTLVKLPFVVCEMKPFTSAATASA